MSGAALLAAISGEDVLQTGFSGIALGCKYALIALGFSIIFKATGVINFAQGGFVLIGAYFTYNVAQTWDQNFYLALVAAMVGGALLGALVEVLLLRRLVGESPVTVIMVTIGILTKNSELVVMQACGMKVTRNPAEMGRLLKSVLK